ncbi:MAG: DUF4783 domain-containing protein [Opitutaceae bacterium]|nr:DUF4783 domain-containing protein [Cytophagales bacterium]
MKFNIMYLRMVKKIACTFVLLTVVVSFASAQDDIVKCLKSSFKSGNIKELSQYMGSRTEIAFNGDKKIYEKASAEQILGNFLLENKPKDFQILHQGASKEGLKFYIGEMTAATGIHRVLVYLRNNDGKVLIETIDISKE